MSCLSLFFHFTAPPSPCFTGSGYLPLVSSPCLFALTAAIHFACFPPPACRLYLLQICLALTTDVPDSSAWLACLPVEEPTAPGDGASSPVFALPASSSRAVPSSVASPPPVPAASAGQPLRLPSSRLCFFAAGQRAADQQGLQPACSESVHTRSDALVAAAQQCSSAAAQLRSSTAAQHEPAAGLRSWLFSCEGRTDSCHFVDLLPLICCH